MISVAHSPDSDDFFLFWAVRHKLIPLGDFEFSLEEHHTEELNRRALDGVHDIIAISTGALAKVHERYAVLSSGVSASRGFGPVLVTKQSTSLESLRKKNIGIPGTNTTSALVLRQILPEATQIEIPIEPFDRIFQSLDSGAVDAAILIHEGQLSYPTRGLHLVLEMGRWWQEHTSLPLVVGINVIRKSLGKEHTAELSNLLQRSVSYALAHRDSLIDELVLINQRRGVDLTTRSDIRAYLERFANEDSLALDGPCQRSIRRLASLANGGKPIDIEFTT